MSAVPETRFEFVPMRAGDLEAVAAAEGRIYPFPWSYGNFADSLAAGYSAWVYWQANVMVGYAVMMMVLDEAHLLNISIVPERQRQGLGSALLERLMAVARGHGARSMFLEVRPTNVSGLALYARFAFKAVGERRGYYPAHDGRENAIVMSRTL